MTESPDFVPDEVSLILLRSACNFNPDTERTHLYDFLAMYGDTSEESEGLQITEDLHHTTVIVTLIDRIEQLTAENEDLRRPTERLHRHLKERDEQS